MLQQYTPKKNGKIFYFLIFLIWSPTPQKVYIRFLHLYTILRWLCVKGFPYMTSLGSTQ